MTNVKDLSKFLKTLYVAKEYLNVNKKNLDPTKLYNIYYKIQKASPYKNLSSTLTKNDKSLTFESKTYHGNHILISDTREVPMFYEPPKKKINKILFGKYSDVKSFLKIHAKKQKFDTNACLISIGGLTIMAILFALAAVNSFMASISGIFMCIFVLSGVFSHCRASYENNYSNVIINKSTSKPSDLLIYINLLINHVSNLLHEAHKEAKSKKYQNHYSDVVNAHQKEIEDNHQSWSDINKALSLNVALDNATKAMNDNNQRTLPNANHQNTKRVNFKNLLKDSKFNSERANAPRQD